MIYAVGPGCEVAGPGAARGGSPGGSVRAINSGPRAPGGARNALDRANGTLVSTDIVWSTNAAEYWALLVQGRGWTPERFGDHLAQMWTRLFLEPRYWR